MSLVPGIAADGAIRQRERGLRPGTARLRCEDAAVAADVAADGAIRQRHCAVHADPAGAAGVRTGVPANGAVRQRRRAEVADPGASVATDSALVQSQRGGRVDGQGAGNQTFGRISAGVGAGDRQSGNGCGKPPASIWNTGPRPPPSMVTPAAGPVIVSNDVVSRSSSHANARPVLPEVLPPVSV